MSCLSRVSNYTAAIVGRAAHLTSRPRPRPTPSSLSFFSSSFSSSSVHRLNPPRLDSVLARCYSSGAAKKRAKGKKGAKPVEVMDPEKDAFFVVRKGDIVGVYKSFSDCQAQAGTSVCDPAVSVYKGYGLPKEAEGYLLSHGLHNALYTIRAADLKDDLFGSLMPCPFQQPSSDKGETLETVGAKKRPRGGLESEMLEADGSTSSVTEISRKSLKLDSLMRSQVLDSEISCILEFDGASRGNPGQAGAGAVLRAADGSLIWRLREGLGVATNNVAEYRAVILGLKCALQKGFTKIRVQGDSKLVCMQGLWKVKHENISKLYEQAVALKDKFLSFQIGHVLREYNSEADAQANLAVKLADGQIQEELVGT